MLSKIAKNELEFIEKHLCILNVNSDLVPFRLNAVQKLYEERRSRFDYILKARKMGISTRIIASDIWACAFQDNTKAVMLTHTKEAQERMMQDRVLPMLKSNDVGILFKATSDQIYFPLTNSTYYVGTAGSKRFGRGDDITRYHLTEFAHYSDPSVLTAIEEACTENAIGRIETTANGDNFAKKLWDETKANRTRYKAIFFPWFCDPRYCMTTSYHRPNDLTEKEKELMSTLSLSVDQISWRREKIRQMSRPELFSQEYPENDLEAFISSNRGVFDWMSLVKQERGCSKPTWRGRLKEIQGKLELELDDRGSLSVWENPKQWGQYVIGADIAEGIEGGAYSAAFVLDIKSMTQVAEWHGHIAPDLFAAVLIDLSNYYNKAWVCPEAWPGPGETTTSHLLNSHFNKVFSFPGDDFIGWKTTSQSKPRMIYELNAALRDLRIQVRSHDLISELKSYIYDEGQRMIPSAGTYSDRIIAAGIAYAVSQNVEIIQQTLKTSGIINHNSGVSVPQWRGSVPGVRQNE